MNLERLPIIGRIVRRQRQADERIDRIVEAVKPELSPQGKEFVEGIGGIFNFPTGQLSNETSISSKLLQANKEWVYRNNDVIAMEVSKIEFELYSLGLKDGEIVFNEINSHPLLDLLDNPNKETSKTDAVYIIQSHKKLAGDAFWLKLRNGATVVALRQLPPDKITLMLQQPTENDPTVIEAFKYKDVIDGKKIEVDYDPKDIIHLKKPSPSNSFRGYGAVEALAETIDVDNLTNLTTKNFFKKGAITNFVLSTDQRLTEDQIKRFEAQLASVYGGGAKNAYKTMILGGGLKPEKLTFSNKDMEFLDQLAWYRDKIMVGFGNTKASLGIIDDVNRASHESSIASWLSSTIKPEMDAIVNTLNEFLVPEFGQNLVLGYVNPVPEDRTDDIAEATQLYSSRLITRNEGRELLDYEPVDDGDSFDSPGGFGALAPSLVNPTDNGDDSEELEGENIDQAGEGAEEKRFRVLRKHKNKNLPPALAHLDVKMILRKRGLYFKQRVNKELKEAFKPIAREFIKNGKKVDKLFVKNEEGYTPPDHMSLSPDQIMDYYQKQIHSVDVIEKHFEAAIVKFLDFVARKVIDRLPLEVDEKKSFKILKAVQKGLVTKDIFDGDDEDLIAQAELDFTPLLMDTTIISGQRAYSLINVDDPYLPREAMRAQITSNVRKFTQSMLDTDREQLTNLIINGVEQGQSVVEIRNQITATFEDIKKNQSQRIVRTEVLRASNQAAKDAWIQSGVVEGKQWITAGATDECADYEGQIETLDSNFFSSDNEFQDGDPPLHPNCRCTLIPIMVGNEERSFNLDKSKFRDRIKELEDKFDKRTKQFKELSDQRRDDKAYIKILESHLNLDESA